MTLSTNARIAGFTFLLYIAAGIASMILFGRVKGSGDIASKLVGIAQHGTTMGFVVLLGMIQSFCALVLAVTLYALTRSQDRDIAMMGMISRVTEGVIGGAGIASTLALVDLATTPRDPSTDLGFTHGLAAYLLRGDVALTATFFAVGSALFAYLLLRGRMIPGALAWIGVVASVLLVIVLPLQLAGFVRGAITQLVWLPMLLFEVPFALWLLTKGVATPARAPME